MTASCRARTGSRARHTRQARTYPQCCADRCSSAAGSPRSRRCHRPGNLYHKHRRPDPVRPSKRSCSRPCTGSDHRGQQGHTPPYHHRAVPYHTSTPPRRPARCRPRDQARCKGSRRKDLRGRTHRRRRRSPRRNRTSRSDLARPRRRLGLAHCRRPRRKDPRGHRRRSCRHSRHHSGTRRAHHVRHTGHGWARCMGCCRRQDRARRRPACQRSRHCTSRSRSRSVRRRCCGCPRCRGLDHTDPLGACLALRPCQAHRRGPYACQDRSRLFAYPAHRPDPYAYQLASSCRPRARSSSRRHCSSSWSRVPRRHRRRGVRARPRDRPRRARSRIGRSVSLR